MIEKILHCIYCGTPMESKTAKKRFCSELHRVYYNREKARGTLNQNDLPNGIVPASKIKDTPNYSKTSEIKIPGIDKVITNRNRIEKLANVDFLKNKEDKKSEMPENLGWKEQLEWVLNNKK